MDRMDGLQRLLDFLQILQKRKIHNFIERQSNDAIRVTFTAIGARVEVYFEVDGMEYSVFKGDEGAASDLDELMKIIADFE